MLKSDLFFSAIICLEQLIIIRIKGFVNSPLLDLCVSGALGIDDIEEWAANPRLYLFDFCQDSPNSLLAKFFNILSRK